MEIQSNFRSEPQPINLGAGNKYLGLSDGTVDKWVPGSIKSLLVHVALEPCPRCLQESGYRALILKWI